MKVKVKGFGDGQCGYYGHVRRFNGDVFEIEDEPRHPEGHPNAGRPVAFSDRWMEAVDPETPVNQPSNVKTRAAARRAAQRPVGAPEAD